MKNESERRLKNAIEYVTAQWGNGWYQLGPRMKEALVRAEVLAEISRLEAGDIDPLAYRELVDALATGAMRWEAE
jgi:hypothetical protein